MNVSKFVIEAVEADRLSRQNCSSLPELLPGIANLARTSARAPISNYHVGAAGLGSSGRMFLGCNLEFPGLPLHHSVHAEQFLITNLMINAEPTLKHVATTSTMCGHCRQFFQEIRDSSAIQIQVTAANSKPQSLSHFLPNRFGPDALLRKDVPLLLEPRDNNLRLCFENASMPNGFHDVFEDLKREALRAANCSHAPYSKCPSGAALMDCEGKIYGGCYMESAAYNPSLGPVQAALVAYVAGGGGGYERIVAAVLAEKDGATVKQEASARLLLQAICSKCEFRVSYCLDQGLRPGDPKTI